MDKNSNEPKGYGFCEFRGKEYVRSAIRNMNDANFNGRPLRVALSAVADDIEQIGKTIAP